MEVYVICVHNSLSFLLNIQSNLCFTIGSVESFERSLEAVQQEMNIDPAFWIPVTYVKESDWL